MNWLQQDLHKSHLTHMRACACVLARCLERRVDGYMHPHMTGGAVLFPGCL